MNIYVFILILCCKNLKIKKIFVKYICIMLEMKGIGYWVEIYPPKTQKPLQIDINANKKLQGRKSFMGIDESIVGLTRKICTL